MALVRKSGEIRAERKTGTGYRGVISRILAGEAQGCGVLTVRMLTVKPSGRLPRREYDFLRVVTVILGRLLFMDGDGAMHVVEEGDVVIIRPHERHHFQNDWGNTAKIIVAEAPGG